MNDCENNNSVEPEVDSQGVEELSDEDLENVAGGWNDPNGGGG